MRKVLKVNWALVLLFAVIFSLTFIPLIYAEEDVTEKVELVKSRLRYDRRAKTTEFSVALKNISEDVLLTPIKVVIDSISDPRVTVANADGYTEEGEPYLKYTIENKNLFPNELTDAKKWIFNNPMRLRFNYSTKIISSGFARGNIDLPLSTKILEKTVLEDNLILTDTTLTNFAFSDQILSVYNLVVNDVLVFSPSEKTPKGALRKIDNIYIQGNTVVVETSQASMTDAIQNCDIEIKQTLTPGDVKSVQLADGVIFTHNSPFTFTFEEGVSDSIVLFDLDGDYETDYDQVTADGHITFSDEIYLNIVIEDWSLVEFIFTNTAGESSGLEIHAGGALSFEKEKVIAEVDLGTYTFYIPIGFIPFPIVINPELGVVVGAEGEVHAEMTTSITQETTLTGGLQYSDYNWSTISELDNDFGYQEPDLTVGGSIKGYIGPRVNILLYSVAGPFCDIEGYLDFSAELFSDPWWTLYGGIEVDVGVIVEILDHELANYEYDGLIDYNRFVTQAELFCDTCDFNKDSGERCFGGVGIGCKSAPGAGPFTADCDTCIVSGWMSIGSILHDKCCDKNPDGYSCDSGPFEGDINKCKEEWDEAWDDTLFEIQWKQDFGPYRYDSVGDDVNKTFKRFAPAGAKIPYNVIVNGSKIDTEEYCLSGSFNKDNEGYPIVKTSHLFGFSKEYCVCSEPIDSDGDSIPNDLDNCPYYYNPDQGDSDGNGIGDLCQDSDGDGINDVEDYFPNDPNEWEDTDNDGIGNNTDNDDDNDGFYDVDDAFPLDATEWIDTDSDGLGDNADPDNDDDGVYDENDNCQNIYNPDQADFDGDGVGDACDQCTELFDHYQNITTKGAHGMVSFEINGENYLAIANSGDPNYYIDSKIYKWNGYQFEEYQSIPTVNAFSFESFKIDNDFFLAVINHEEPNNNPAVNSSIYKWNYTTLQFERFQDILTYGAVCWKSFKINNETYLAVANGRNLNYNTDSKIYKWTGSFFIEYQSISTFGAHDFEFFEINNQSYMAVANTTHCYGYPNPYTFDTNSYIYIWNKSNLKFEEYQSILTHGAYDWEYFTINGHNYLAVANGHSGTNSSRTYHVDSVIYIWDNITNIFEEYQKIPTIGACSWEHLTINGNVYLGIANRRSETKYNIDSKIFKWSDSDKDFKEIQLINTYGAYDLESFTIDGYTYLGISNAHHDNYGRITNSFIYRFNADACDEEPQHDIVFLSDRSGYREIWTTSSDDPTNAKRITYFDAPVNPIAPKWSPDGKWIAYAANISGYNQIFVVDSTSMNEPIQLTNETNAACSSPDFGHENSIIYFIKSYPRSHGEIWKINIETKEIEPINQTPNVNQHSFDISSSGNLRVEMRENGCCNSYNMYTVLCGSVGEKIILGVDGKREKNVRFDYTEERITFDQKSGNKDIWIMDIDGTNRRQLTYSTVSVRNSSPVFSPDGSQILFTTTLNGNDDLYLLDPSDSSIEPFVVGSDNDHSADWLLDTNH